MRKPALFSALAACAIGSLALASSPLAQQRPPLDADVLSDVRPEVPPDAPPKRYLVTVAEYRLDPPPGPTETAEAVLKRALANEGSAAVETVRLSVPGGEESSATFGRTAFVQSGRTVMGRGDPVRQYQAVDVGTILRARVEPELEAERIGVRLSYESSRLDEPPADEDLPRGKTIVTFETSLRAELGRPALVAGRTAGDAAVLTLTVEEI